MMLWTECRVCGFDSDAGDVCSACQVAEAQSVNGDLPARRGEGEFTPRPYQLDAVKEVFAAWSTGKNSVLIEMATGLGKTVVFSEICLRWPEGWGRILILAHRTELIQQACAKVGDHMGQTPEIEKANRKAQRHRLLGSDVVVASVQTITQRHRLERFDPHDFGLIITDEAHHATSKSYRRIFQHFRENKDCKMLGVTATPERADGTGLIHVFDGGIVYKKDIKDGINDGYLVPVRQAYQIIESLDFALVRKVAGDFQKSDLEKMMLGEYEEQAKEESPLLGMASAIVEQSENKPTLVFCVTKKHALAMTEILSRYPGVKAECVIDDTPTDERARIIERYKEGDVQILCGVGVFTEGFDAPLTELVVIARPTQSLGLYIQMVGRGTRPAPGIVDGLETAEERRQAIADSVKPACRVLDFVGVSGKHTLVSTASIFGGFPTDVAQAVENAKKKGGFSNMEEEIQEAKKARWAEMEAKRQRQERLIAEAKYRSVEVDPFGGSMGGGPADNTPTRPRGTATDKQVDYLVKLGIPRATAETWSKSQAGSVIDQRMRLSGGKFRITFGKHAGKALNELPPKYVEWMCYRNQVDGDFAQVMPHIEAMDDATLGFGT